MNNQIVELDALDLKTLQSLLQDLFGKIKEGQYKIGTVCDLSGVTLRQLSYWTDKGVIEANIIDGLRRYSGPQIIKVLMVKLCLDSGVSLEKAINYTNAYFGFLFENKENPGLTNCPLSHHSQTSLETILKQIVIEKLVLSIGHIEDMGLAKVTRRQIKYWQVKGIINSIEDVKGDEEREFAHFAFKTVFEINVICHLLEKMSLQRATKVLHHNQALIESVLGETHKLCESVTASHNPSTSAGIAIQGQLAGYLPSLIVTFEDIEKCLEQGLPEQAFVLSCYGLIRDPMAGLLSEGEFQRMALELMHKMTAMKLFCQSPVRTVTTFNYNPRSSDYIEEKLPPSVLVSCTYLLLTLVMTDKLGLGCQPSHLNAIIKKGCLALINRRLLINMGCRFRLYPYIGNNLRFAREKTSSNTEQSIIKVVNDAVISLPKVQEPRPTQPTRFPVSPRFSPDRRTIASAEPTYTVPEVTQIVQSPAASNFGPLELSDSLRQRIALTDPLPTYGLDGLKRLLEKLIDEQLAKIAEAEKAIDQLMPPLLAIEEYENLCLSDESLPKFSSLAIENLTENIQRQIAAYDQKLQEEDLTPKEASHMENIVVILQELLEICQFSCQFEKLHAQVLTRLAQ